MYVEVFLTTELFQAVFTFRTTPKMKNIYSPATEYMGKQIKVCAESNCYTR